MSSSPSAMMTTMKSTSSLIATTNLNSRSNIINKTNKVGAASVGHDDGAKRGDRFVQKSFNTDDENSNARITTSSSSQQKRLTSQQLALFAAHYHHHAASSLNNKRRGQKTNSTKGKSDANVVTFAAASSSGNSALVNGKGANAKILLSSCKYETFVRLMKIMRPVAQMKADQRAESKPTREEDEVPAEKSDFTDGDAGAKSEGANEAGAKDQVEELEAGAKELSLKDKDSNVGVKGEPAEVKSGSAEVKGSK